MSNPDSANWIYAMDAAALLEGRMAAAYPLGVNVPIARVGGKIYAVSGKCVHMPCPLFMGQLEGHTITCPCRDWRFDVRTGKFFDAAELGLAVYSTKLPLIKSASKTARNKNIRTEIAAGKPPKQAVAIGYAIQRRAKAKGQAS
jgi:3-phenylpropionate/trans-cinnamate dioxygenase ferredoxin subunit